MVSGIEKNRVRKRGGRGGRAICGLWLTIVCRGLPAHRRWGVGAQWGPLCWRWKAEAGETVAEGYYGGSLDRTAQSCRCTAASVPNRRPAARRGSSVAVLLSRSKPRSPFVQAGQSVLGLFSARCWSGFCLTFQLPLVDPDILFRASITTPHGNRSV